MHLNPILRLGGMILRGLHHGILAVHETEGLATVLGRGVVVVAEVAAAAAVQPEDVTEVQLRVPETGLD